jgi:hypothetical protein
MSLRRGGEIIKKIYDPILSIDSKITVARRKALPTKISPRSFSEEG